MRVINVSGLTYGFTHNGRTIVIPFDRREYYLDDDVDTTQFGRAIRITVPPVLRRESPPPVIEEKVLQVEEPKESVENIITLDLSDFDLKEPPVVIEKKPVVKTPKIPKVEKKSF